MDRLDLNTDIACTLNDADFHERRAFARKRLVPHISQIERTENGLIFRLNTEVDIAEYLNTFVELERQCCGFLTFTIIQNQTDGAKVVGLKIEGPPEASETLEIFAQAANSHTL